MSIIINPPNDQEKFWSGEFGNHYTQRCTGEERIKSNEELFRRALRCSGWVDNYSGYLKDSYSGKTVIEFGANRGLNIYALSRLGFKTDNMSAVEINDSACCHLNEIPGLIVYNQSMYDECHWAKHDLVISRGVLIHQAPDWLPEAYEVLYNACKVGGYILTAEYHASTPTEVKYRGHDGKLWRRDFASEMLDRFRDLKVRDYGFVWKRDPVAPQDDIVWTLMYKA
jgi:pseudaminic acid biosynthesis-associated methylase